jgi:hypothetical protein
MGDHTYKRVEAGRYTSSLGIEIVKKDGRGRWDVYLPAPRRGVILAGTRPSLREAKVAAAVHMRNMIDKAHAEALANSNFDLMLPFVQSATTTPEQMRMWFARHGIDLRVSSALDLVAAREADHAEALSEYFDRELEAVAAARKIELDRIEAVEPVSTPDLNLDDIRRLFDLAVDSPLLCSGSFETDDVALLARLAATLGVDPHTITEGTDFEAEYRHPFKSRLVRALVGVVGEWITAEGEVLTDYPDPRLPGTRFRTRPETGAEAQARIAAERADLTCQVNRCGKPEDDAIHSAWAGPAT